MDCSYKENEYTFIFFIRNLCDEVEAEVPYFFKEPHSSLICFLTNLQQTLLQNFVLHATILKDFLFVCF